MSVKFWLEDPTVLLNKSHILNMWPAPCMSVNEKLNAITRLVILLTVFYYAVSRQVNILWIGVITLVIIVVLHYIKKRKVTVDDLKEGIGKEGFDTIYSPSFNSTPELYNPITPANPFGNTLVTDYADNPDKLPAPHAADPPVVSKINENVVQSIFDQNMRNTDSTKLFTSLGDTFQFEQSMRNFYTMPSTQIPHNQGAFADFCYGNMISCKEGNEYACARYYPRHTMV